MGRALRPDGGSRPARRAALSLPCRTTSGSAAPRGSEWSRIGRAGRPLSTSSRLAPPVTRPPPARPTVTIGKDRFRTTSPVTQQQVSPARYPRGLTALPPDDDFYAKKKSAGRTAPLNKRAYTSAVGRRPFRPTVPALRLLWPREGGRRGRVPPAKLGLVEPTVRPLVHARDSRRGGPLLLVGSTNPSHARWRPSQAPPEAPAFDVRNRLQAKCQRSARC